MSNVVTEQESFNHYTEVMTLDNHHNHTDDGDTAAATQVNQGIGIVVDESECNNTQMEQRESTIKTPCSPPDNVGGSIHDEHITSINSLSDAVTTTTTTTGVNTNNIITLMQSSPPPHNYRHSRAYRHFKNPPQPHMCIRTTTEAGEELFINVLSWTRIVIPQEPSDPIPLYGGMRVPPGSPRSPPIVFAVMANPEVLKDSGRHSKDPEERRAMVELMCDFVEAMNPGVKLVRNAVILKDRDISGELKDVWNAVQAQRDREREEQMLQQRQQQHYHNITTQQMFPKSGENNSSTTAGTTGPITQQYQYASQQQQQSELEQQQEQYIDSEMIQMTTNESEATMSTTTNVETQYAGNGVDNNTVLNADIIESNTETMMNDALAVESNINVITTPQTTTTEYVEETFKNAISNMNGNNDAGDQTDAGNKADKNVEMFADNNKPNIRPSANNNNSKNGNPSATATPATSPKSTNVQLDVVASLTTAPVAVATNNPANNSLNTPSLPSVTSKVSTSTSTPTATATPIAVPPTKKDKLGGFLPNGCIFPRFKHNKNKDKDKEKDKDKDKESKGKDKEKTLLNALKKSKDKKIAPSEQLEKTLTPATTTSDSSIVDSKSQYEKNFINLESEVQRLDLNKIDATTGNDNSMFIKLKMSTSSATAK